MKFAALVTLAATLVTALPQIPHPTKDYCLTLERAHYIVAREKAYVSKADLADARAAGEELFAPYFQQYSDSVNSLRGDPLGTLVEPDAATYVNNTLSAPPIRVVNTLAVLYNCTHIFWQWQFFGVGGPTAPNRVNGFLLIEVDNKRETQPVIGHYVEFNSLAWAENTGYNITAPAYD